MELSHSLRMRQQAKLVMTPQLQQVIRLLQLNTVDLVDLVHQELETNPALEEGPDETGGEPVAEAPPETDRAAAAEESMDSWLSLAADGGPREVRDRDREDEIEQMQERRLVAAGTLAEHLLNQLHETEAPARTVGLAEFLVGNLDTNGWLASPLEELTGPAGATLAELEEALALVQSLDPRGIAARDLKECLLLQLRDQPGDTALAQRIVSEHLARLESPRDGTPEALARDLGADVATVVEAMRRIRACDPKPGRPFAEAAPAVFPDGRIEKIGSDYVIVLNDNGVPPLRLSTAYRELLANRATLGEEERRYLQERFRSALMLMRGIEQRRVTLHKVLEHIVKAQRDFLDRGPAHLRPLTLREVADAIGVHESTVSRVVANKHVQTPRGFHALKDFFSNRIAASSGDGTSSAAVRERLRDLIEGENPEAPLSDEQLADALRRGGVAIARRTVTKYREALEFPAAWQRKQKASAAAEHGAGPRSVPPLP